MIPWSVKREPAKARNLADAPEYNTLLFAKSQQSVALVFTLLTF